MGYTLRDCGNRKMNLICPELKKIATFRKESGEKEVIIIGQMDGRHLEYWFVEIQGRQPLLLLR